MINEPAPVNQKDVAKSLRSEGISTPKADSLAQAITARLNGQELTKVQRSILSFELGNPLVKRVISEFMKKKSDGIDSTKNNVYDKSDIGDRLFDEEKSASWDGSNHKLPLAAQQRELTSHTDSFEDASVAGRILSNGQSIDDMAELYSEKVRSNRKWRWRDGFPNGGRLSKNDKIDIRKYAIEKGLIPNVPVNVVTDASGKTYRYADFDAAGVVKESVELPEYLWSKSDAVHIKWLDNKIGGRPKGHTWHHSEKAGQMELVPTGIHNVYHHNGGRTVNHWAYRKGGR